MSKVLDGLVSTITGGRYRWLGLWIYQQTRVCYLVAALNALRKDHPFLMEIIRLHAEKHAGLEHDAETRQLTEQALVVASVLTRDQSGRVRMTWKLRNLFRATTRDLGDLVVFDTAIDAIRHAYAVNGLEV
ncbi:MAG: hypothetical protein U0136_04785 [Bdellovibrionota bacterium]